MIVAANDAIPPKGGSVSGAAATELSPILLTHRDTLPERTRALLGRFPGIVIVGGTAAVSVSEEVAEVAGATSVAVERIAGNNRYEASSGVVREFSPDTHRPWLVTGEHWADALAAGPAAADDHSALLLVPGREPPTEEWFARVEEFLGELDRVLLVGGEAAISREWEDAVRAEAVSRRTAQAPGP